MSLMTLPDPLFPYLDLRKEQGLESPQYDWFSVLNITQSLKLMGLIPNRYVQVCVPCLIKVSKCSTYKSINYAIKCATESKN